ncbi:hypothetical protein GGE58_004703 [Rhizobium lentis]|nr:hypothetical protein [Rhizobium lentis]
MARLLVNAVWMLGTRPSMTEGEETDGAILGVGIRVENASPAEPNGACASRLS